MEYQLQAGVWTWEPPRTTGRLGDGTERQEVWVDVTARGKADNSHGIPLRQICRQEAGSEEQQE